MVRKFASIELALMPVLAFVFVSLASAGAALAQCDFFTSAVEYSAGDGPAWDVAAVHVDNDG